jgi:uncharacterized protein (TIGR02246 family)
MRAKGTVILICAMAMIFGIQATPFSAQAEKLSDADIAAVKKLVENWEKAWLAKDWDALLALYSDQTIEIFPNGIANVGKSNLTRRFQGFWPNYTYEELKHSDISIAGFGDTASFCSRFSQTFRYKDDEKATTRQGNQFFIFKKIDGSWKIAAAHWNFD